MFSLQCQGEGIVTGAESERRTMIKLPRFSELEYIRPPQATVATGGSVRLKDSEGRQLLSDLDDGTVYYPQGDGLLEEPITVVTNSKHDVTHSDVQVEEQETIQEKSNKPKTKRYNKIQIDTPRGERIDFGGIDVDELETDPDNAKYDEDELFIRYMKAAITTGVGDTFPNMMKRQPIQDAVPYQLRKIYRQWMMEVFDDLEEKDIPMKGKLKAGLRFPEPSGERWKELVDGYENKHAKRAVEGEDERMIQHYLSAMWIQETQILRALKGDKDKEVKKLVTKIRRKRKREKLVQSGQTAPPGTLTDAFCKLDKETAKEWMKSADEEMDGLTEQGVVEHDFTMAELEAAGVKKDKVTGRIKPIPLSVVLDHKYTDGTLSRRKVRMAISGHPGNMQKGVHFHETFAASPNQHTMRMLQALCVIRGYKRLSFDIKQAYTRAEIPPGDLIALRYPVGFRRQKDGQETYMLLKKNLYGHPAAARAWTKTRDAFIEEEFNKDGWRCVKCIMDPCLFRFTKGKEEVMALIHTDDVDMIGGSEEMMKDIMDKCDKEWGVKQVDSDFILGVKRIYKEDKITGERSIEMTMTAFIEGMHAAYGDQITKKKVSSPFPDDVFISKGDRKKTSDEEAK